MSKVEEYIEKYTRYCSNLLTTSNTSPDSNTMEYYEAWLTPDNARIAAMMARKETIDKAISFIQEASKGLDRDEDVKQFIEDFIKAVKGE